MSLFIYAGMLGMLLVFFASLYFMLNRKTPTRFLSASKNWQIALFLIALAFLCFFIYFNSTMQLIQLEEIVTGSNGNIYSISNNSYIEFYSYMPYMVGALVLVFVLNAGSIILNFNVFGRGRLSRKSGF